MKLFRKLMLIILAAACVGCVSFAAACAKGDDDGTFYTVVFQKTNGVTYVLPEGLSSGMQVKEGTEISFSVQVDSAAQGEAEVYAAVTKTVFNAEAEGGAEQVTEENKLTPDGGNYTFTVVGNTRVHVDGINAVGDYNLITFKNNAGVTFTSDVKSGMYVKSGYTVSFKITVNEHYKGTPLVYAKSLDGTDTQIIADAEGNYSFEMTSPTEVRVEGLVRSNRVTFDKHDEEGNEVRAWLRYSYEGDNGTQSGSLESADGVLVDTGKTFSFTVDVSVYYKQEYDVVANTVIVKPDSNGVYNYKLESDGDVVINVMGLELDDSFVTRADGGNGTAANPFKIARPIDLYEMAMFINGGWYTDGTFYAGYYSLENDIDLEGEQLFIIGDNGAANGTAVFCGDFNGNNHTIKNFYISDTMIDQELYVPVFMPNIGMFGYATATTTHQPSIYNLTLDGFEIDVDAGVITEEEGTNIFVGGIVGCGIGVNVVGCNVKNAVMNVIADDNYYAYVGGIVGFQQPAIGTSRFYSSVSSCTADVEINALAGSVYALGGITGMLVTNESDCSAYVLNCASSGSLSGAMRTGGVVGCMSEYTAVMNSYSICDVSAYTSQTTSSVTNPIAANSYAGGVVGYAGFNSVVSGCFSKQDNLQATAAEGTSHAYTDKVLGGTLEDGEPDINSFSAVIYNCHPVGDESVTLSKSYIRDTMKWGSQDWSFTDGRAVPNLGSTAADTGKDYTITLNYGTQRVGSASTKALAVKISGNAQLGEKMGYYPLSYWYNNFSSEIPEFIESDGHMRSYGYFFDSDCTERVPAIFVPTDDITLYVGFANYASVAGKYYLAADGNSPVITIEPDGTFEYRNGALTAASNYLYNGTYITLINAYLGELYDFDSDLEREQYLSQMYTYKAVVDSAKNTITITGGYVEEMDVQLVEGEISATPTGNHITLFPDAAPLKGMKLNSAFTYGTYYGSDVEYTFRPDGTGVRTRTGSAAEFTYTVDDTTITLNYGGSESYTGTVTDGVVKTVDNDVSVSAYDKFMGTWEKSATSHKEFTFDGKNGWKYEYFGYEDGEKTSIETKQGTYTIQGGEMTLSGDITATAQFNADGYLEITQNGYTEVYYKDGSYVGDWYFGNVRNNFNLSFLGITNEGYGEVKVVATDGAERTYGYSASRTSGASASDVITIYNSYNIYAVLTFNAADSTLRGTIDGVSARFTLTDEFKGVWISNEDNMETLNFDGNGLYNLNGDSSTGAIAVKGYVRITSGATTSTYSYLLEKATMKGSFSIGSTKYTIEYLESEGKVKITPPSGSGEEFEIFRLDIWANRTLVDGDGTKYTFDGKGSLDKGGTMTAKEVGESIGDQYTYKIEGETINIESQTAGSGTITVDGNSWKLSIGTTNETLTLYTPFTGDWHVGGHPSGSLTVGTIGKDLTATGSFYDDSEVTFTYSEEEEYLTFEYDGTTLASTYGGKTVYLKAVEGEGGYELRLGTTPENCNVICVDEADSLSGRQFKDSGNNTLVFDGAGTTTLGSGIAIVTTPSGQTAAIYAYVMDDFGHAYINGDTPMIFAPCEATESDAYTEGGESFRFVIPDSVYGYRIKDVEDSETTYTFDGLGNVTQSDGVDDTVYKYVIESVDTVAHTIRLTFTADGGAIYTAVINYASSNRDNWTLTLTQQA